MRVAVIAYTGDGVDNRAVSAGFAVEVAIVQRGATVENITCKTSAMTGNNSHQYLTGIVTDGIKTLTSDGITLGTNTSVNANTVAYRLIVFGADSNLGVGTYTGNGVDDRTLTHNATTGNAVALTLIMRDQGVSSDWTLRYGFQGDNSRTMWGTGLAAANRIQAATVGSTFTVGTDASVNAVAGDTYYWVHINTVTNNIYSTSYTGDGADNRNIVAADPFTPIWVQVTHMGSAGLRGCHNTEGTDSTFTPQTASGTADLIQAFNSDGFQVGTSTQVNGAGAADNTYGYVIMKDFGAPAAALLGDTGFGGFTLPDPFRDTPYALFKTMLDVYKRYRSVRIQ